MSYIVHHPAEIGLRLLQHVELTFVALALACALAFPLGVLVARRQRAGGVILGVLGAIYTIPSLALFALLIPLFGIGYLTALVALVAYAQMILVRNVATGLRSVPPAQREAARGLGLSPWQTLWRVELPHALPVIVGGIRIATVSLIAIANLAAWIDAGGMGTLLFAGMQRDQPDMIVAGSLVTAALAIAADQALRAAERAARRSFAR